jgi:hypothetical protein
MTKKRIKYDVGFIINSKHTEPGTAIIPARYFYSSCGITV